MINILKEFIEQKTNMLGLIDPKKHLESIKYDKYYEHHNYIYTVVTWVPYYLSYNDINEIKHFRYFATWYTVDKCIEDCGFTNYIDNMRRYSNKQYYIVDLLKEIRLYKINSILNE
jgi:hypothetical protein